jgi:hypothetical protein
MQRPISRCSHQQRGQECRLPHQRPWTASSVVPARDPAALAAATAAGTGQAQAPLSAITMPLPVLVTKTVNAIMPMINHISMTQNDQSQQLIQGWSELLQVRLNCVRMQRMLWKTRCGFRDSAIELFCTVKCLRLIASWRRCMQATILLVVFSLRTTTQQEHLLSVYSILFAAIMAYYHPTVGGLRLRAVQARRRIIDLDLLPSDGDDSSCHNVTSIVAKTVNTPMPIVNHPLAMSPASEHQSQN